MHPEGKRKVYIASSAEGGCLATLTVEIVGGCLPSRKRNDNTYIPKFHPHRQKRRLGRRGKGVGERWGWGVSK